MLTYLFLSVFPALLIASAISDVARFTIPNTLTLALVALFLPAAFAAGMPLSVFGMHVLAGAIMFAVGFALFLPNYIGGGDAKLMAGAALWLGTDLLVPFLFNTAIFGGVMCLVLLSFRKVPLPGPLTHIGWVGRLHRADAPLPYGLAIAASGLLLIQKSVWIALIA